MSTTNGAEVRIQRAGQLDAERLDDELSTLFQSSAIACLRFFPTAVVENYSPEIKALFRLFFFSNTIAIHSPSPGNDFQNLRYSTDLPSLQVRQKLGVEGLPLTRAQRALYMVLQIVLPYSWERLRLFARSDEWLYDSVGSWRYRAWTFLNHTETILRILSLANLLAFLRDGRYRSLVDRILRMRLVYADINATRRPSFEFLNRQLVWQGVAELLLYLSPIVTTGQLSRLLSRTRIGRRLLGGFGRPGALRAGGVEVGAQGEACVLCADGKANMPHRALPCRCRFCYVCIATALESDPTLRCAACDTAVHSYERIKFG